MKQQQHSRQTNLQVGPEQKQQGNSTCICSINTAIHHITPCRQYTAPQACLITRPLTVTANNAPVGARQTDQQGWPHSCQDNGSSKRPLSAYRSTNNTSTTGHQCCVQAQAMTKPTGSAAADARESRHKYNTRHQLGRPEAGEKQILRQGQSQKQQCHPGAMVHCRGTRAAGAQGHCPAASAAQRALQLRTGLWAQNPHGCPQWPAMSLAVCPHQ